MGQEQPRHELDQFGLPCRACLVESALQMRANGGSIANLNTPPGLRQDRWMLSRKLNQRVEDNAKWPSTSAFDWTCCSERDGVRSGKAGQKRATRLGLLPSNYSCAGRSPVKSAVLTVGRLLPVNPGQLTCEQAMDFVGMGPNQTWRMSKWTDGRPTIK